MYKVINLFGEEEVRFVERSGQRPNLFNDYDSFIDKFEVKKTTDDCYTPPEIFSIVLNYVNEKCNIEHKQIIRPFYPGGDFEIIDYPADCVVVDNPPFSIISKICRFYIDRNIKFFLFAPHLTLFSSDIDATHIVVGGNVTYKNGATVKTSFISNMFGDIKIIGDAELLARFRQLEEKNRVNLPKYEYPNNVITVSQIAYLLERGISLQVDKKDVKHCRGLDDQKKHKKAIYGSGFLLSDKAAADKAAADKENIVYWELSEKELKIIRSLG